MIFSAGFIIENLDLNPVAALISAGHNLVVRGDEMGATIILEGFDVDIVAVPVVGEHDEMITTKRGDG